MMGRFQEKRLEQRQHINLSDYAYNILRSDSLAFMGGQNISGMINTIFLNFYQSADASVSHALEHRRAAFLNYLQVEKYRKRHPQDKDLTFFSGETISPHEENVIDTVLSGYAQDIIASANSYPKQKVLKVRLRNEVQDIIYPPGSDTFLESDYYKTPSDYLKAVIEEYSHKCYFDRESIFLKDMLELLHSEVETPDSEKHILTITYNRPSEGTAKLDIKPYLITDQSPSEYHYLIALSSPSGKSKPDYKIAVFRIAWIENIQIRPKSYGSGRITKAQLEYLEKSMRESISLSITYDSSELLDFKILFTPVGLKKYYQINHLRPLAEQGLVEYDENGNTIMYFHSSFHQIHHYFFKLGKDIKILEPENVAEAFKKEYEEAFLSYCDSDL